MTGSTSGTDISGRTSGTDVSGRSGTSVNPSETGSTTTTGDSRSMDCQPGTGTANNVLCPVRWDLGDWYVWGAGQDRDCQGRGGSCSAAL